MSPIVGQGDPDDIGTAAIFNILQESEQIPIAVASEV